MPSHPQQLEIVTKRLTLADRIIGPEETLDIYYDARSPPTLSHRFMMRNGDTINIILGQRSPSFIDLA